jgi:hypothetical protein
LRAGHAGYRQQTEQQKEKGQIRSQAGECWFHAADISRPNLTGQ